MNKKAFYQVLIALSLGAAIFMYKTGQKNRKLTELKQVWWMPLPITVVAFIGLSSAGKQEEAEKKKPV